MLGWRCPKGTIGLLLFVSITSFHAATGQDRRGAGAEQLSSLVRALELSGQESVQIPSSRSFIPPRSRNFPTGPSRFAPPTSESRFSTSNRESSKPPRRESILPSPSKPSKFEPKALPESPSSAPVATSNSEFRFGSIKPRSSSSRITYIPQDRGARFVRPLPPHQAAAAAGKFSNPPKPTLDRKTTTKAPRPRAPVTQKPKTTNAYEYPYDDYYDEYYYYDDKVQGNDSEKRGNQPEDLGPIDPPMTKNPLQKFTTPKPPIVRTSTEFTPKIRFTTTATRTTNSQSRSSGRPSLSDRLLILHGKDQNAAVPRTSNELQSPRDGRILTPTSTTHTQLQTSSSPIKFSTTTPRSPSVTTTEPRMEIRVTNTTESTFVVANIQTSRSVSMRQDDYEDTTNSNINPESTASANNKSKDKIDNINQPSLTSIFGNIDVQFNGSVDGPIEETTFVPRPDSTKVIDITTEAEKLSTTEKIDFPAFLDNIFDGPSTIDPSLLPSGFSITEKSSTTTEKEMEMSLAKKIELSLAATTQKSNDNVRDNLLQSSDNNQSETDNGTESVSPSKEDILFASIFGNAKPSGISSSLLPAGFNIPEKTVPSSALPPTFNVPVGLSNVPTHLLPKGFNSPSVTSPATTTKSSKPKGVPFPVSKSPKGLIFPKRISRPSFLTTTGRPTTPYVAPSGPELLRPTLVNIFDRIKTTPKFVAVAPTKPPKKFEELQAEVTPEGPESSTSSTSTTTTTTTTTTSTTTQPPPPTTPGVCGEKCRLSATLRIVAGAKWVPELANRDTKEFQTLAKSITNELNAVYQRSQLNRWFVGVEIDSFNPGSILVDYFLLLNDISTALDTIDLKQMMNGMLENSNRAEYNLGPLTMDPESTNFIVIKERQRSVIRDDGSYLIPEWLIAVIVISLASFLFIIIFGITVLVSRARVRKRNVPLTEEVLNKLNANQLAGVDNYHHDSIYDMEAIWDEKTAGRNMKPPSSRGRGYNPNYNINIYDSWRTDWSGPYGSSATYAKRRPEANF